MRENSFQNYYRFQTPNLSKIDILLYPLND